MLKRDKLKEKRSAPLNKIKPATVMSTRASDCLRSSAFAPQQSEVEMMATFSSTAGSAGAPTVESRICGPFGDTTMHAATTAAGATDDMGTTLAGGVTTARSDGV